MLFIASIGAGASTATTNVWLELALLTIEARPEFFVLNLTEADEMVERLPRGHAFVCLEMARLPQVRCSLLWVAGVVIILFPPSLFCRRRRRCRRRRHLFLDVS